MNKPDDGDGSGGQAAQPWRRETEAGGRAGETASTRFCWAYGGKEGREVFSLETTINGSVNEAEIESHIVSAIRAMGAVFRHGGRARWNGLATSASADKTLTREPAEPAPAYKWGRSRTGKNALVLHKGASEPEEIECPLHAGKIMKRRANESGAWMSHKEGDSYCTARISSLES